MNEFFYFSFFFIFEFFEFFKIFVFEEKMLRFFEKVEENRKPIIVEEKEEMNI